MNLKDYRRNGKEIRFKTTSAEMIAKVASRHIPNSFSMENQSQLLDIFSEREFVNEFCGGTTKDLSDPHTKFDTFDEAKAKLSSSKLFENMVETFGQTHRRVRTRSQYDGEYDYDKRWEIAPFMQRQRLPVLGRIVNLNIYTSWSGSTDADDIERYCAFLAAIINLIEASGVMVALTMFNEGLAITGGKDGFSFSMETPIKSSNEYVSTGELLKLLGPNYHRRAYFLGIVCAAQSVGMPVAFGLGKVKYYPKRWVADRETGTFSIYSMPLPGEQAKLIEGIMSLCGNEKVDK